MDRLQYRAKSKLTYSETQSRNVYYFTCKNAACFGGQPSKSTFPRKPLSTDAKRRGHRFTRSVCLNCCHTKQAYLFYYTQCVIKKKNYCYFRNDLNPITNRTSLIYGHISIHSVICCQTKK